MKAIFVIKQFTIESWNQAHHLSKLFWMPSIRDMMSCKRESKNISGPYAVTVLFNSFTVLGHVQENICSLFTILASKRKQYFPVRMETQCEVWPGRDPTAGFKACPHLSQFESTSISHLCEVWDWSGCVTSIHFDCICTTEQACSDSENQRKFSHDNPRDKPHPFKRNAAGHAGLVVAVLFHSLSLKNPSQSSSEGTTDEASVKKETKEASRSEKAAKVRFLLG